MLINVTIKTFLLMALAIGGVVFLMRLQPETLISDKAITDHGNDDTLILGDYLRKWGVPTGMDTACGDSYWSYTGGYGTYYPTSCHTIDIWWNSVEIDVDTHNFGPYSTVEYTSDGDKQSAGTVWRGFVTVP